MCSDGIHLQGLQKREVVFVADLLARVNVHPAVRTLRRFGALNFCNVLHDAVYVRTPRERLASGVAASRAKRSAFKRSRFAWKACCAA